MKIDGKQIAKKILNYLKNRIQKLNVVPHLAIILVGNDPASIAYIEQKKLKAEQIGAKTTMINLDSKIGASELNEEIKKLNSDHAVHGIIVQRPLPLHVDSRIISLAISPKKDVDGFHPNSEFEMPIALAVLRILKEVHASTPGVDVRKIVVIGKGETGGQPIIQTLKKMGINPTVIDSKTKNPEIIMKNADVIISSVGKPHVIKANMIKKGVTLISIGLHKGFDGKLHGDYSEKEIKDIASFYTPTPGGVGPVNVAMLLKNLLIACENFSR
jgi:methylenetetrahydrofolate dehydrogenase (NADP+)/methenyltetrahydrofolate cyclohydrolase